MPRINPNPPKRYSRKALIAYFKSLPPRSRPCSGSPQRCPISLFMNWDDNCRPYGVDRRLVSKIDGVPGAWGKLTAKRIVEIAESL